MADRMGTAYADANRRRSKKEEGGSSGIKAEKTEMTETEKESLSSVAGKGLGKGETGDDLPKQQPGESLSSFGERMRKARERKRGVTMDQAGGALARKM